MTAWRIPAIPAATTGGRYHGGEGMDQWQGDCGRAIRRCALRLPGKRFIDLNFQGRWNLHSRTARANGYRFIVTEGRKRRPMSPAELNRDLDDWNPADILKWRRTAKAGRSYESRLRPGTYAERVRLAQRLRVKICAEIKSNIDEATATQMVAYAVAKKATVYFMALVYQVRKTPARGASMAIAGRKAKTITEAGGQFALLTHGFPPPNDLDEYRPYIARFWGANAKEYRE